MNDNTHASGFGIEGGGAVRLGEWTGVRVFSDVQQEYHAALDGLGIVERSYRATLEITGADARTWINNFVTNQIATLGVGDGAYTFALDVKGRIQFDANVLLMTDTVLLDLDHRFVQHAARHLGKYAVIEDVAIATDEARRRRVTLVGPKAGEALATLGLGNARAFALWQCSVLDIGGVACPVFRHDLLGTLAFDLVMPVDVTEAFWDRLVEEFQATRVGYDTAETLRIEHVIPAPFSEITDDVLPTETDQADRAVSYKKGCYLGQEIVERMRSRNAAARKLTLLRVAADEPPAVGTELLNGDQHVGSVTSACQSVAHGGPIALAYLRVASAAPDTPLTLADSGAKVLTLSRPPRD